MALVFMLYALFMYKSRTRQILRRETLRYDDQRGPVVLTLLLVAAVLVVYTITIRAAFGKS